MKSKKVVIANWKMNKTREQTHEFFKEFGQKILDTKNKNIGFCVPYTNVSIAREYADEIGVMIGAQNFYPAKNGAYTGEISPEMLAEVGAHMVLVGHSERRALFGETDELINQKVKSAIENKFIPIFCIGETLEQRENGKMEEVLRGQIQQGLKDVQSIDNVIIAYEPVWAIGTGKVATLEQIEQTHAFVKSVVREIYEQEPVLLYGGSANEKNACEIMSTKGVDGVLVGGASLDVDKFTAIINS